MLWIFNYFNIFRSLLQLMIKFYLRNSFNVFVYALLFSNYSLLIDVVGNLVSINLIVLNLAFLFNLVLDVLMVDDVIDFLRIAHVNTTFDFHFYKWLVFLGDDLCLILYFALVYVCDALQKLHV